MYVYFLIYLILNKFYILISYAYEAIRFKIIIIVHIYYTGTYVSIKISIFYNNCNDGLSRKPKQRIIHTNVEKLFRFNVVLFNVKNNELRFTGKGLYEAHDSNLYSAYNSLSYLYKHPIYL